VSRGLSAPAELLVQGRNLWVTGVGITWGTFSRRKKHPWWRPLHGRFDRKSRNLHTSPLFNVAVAGEPFVISQRCLVSLLELLGYHMTKKVWWYVKLFQYNTGTRQTDRRTNRITVSLSHVSIAVLTSSWSLISHCDWQFWHAYFWL